LSKNDSLFSFEQVICSDIASRWASGCIHPGCRFWRFTNTLCSKI